MCTHHKQGFNLCVYAKPAFAIQTSRPQPITTNPITVYMQHLISRKVCSGLCEQCRDSNEHTLPFVRACQCVCMSPCWLTRRLFPGLARRHVWLAACRFHHIAPETEADLVASSPTGLSLSVSPPLCLFLSLAVCLTVRLSRALRRVLADFGFVWQAELWGSTLIEETEQKLTLLSLKQLSSSARWSHRWYAHGKEIHVKTLTHVHTGWFTHATIGQLTGTVVAPVMYVEANKHPSLSPHPAYASQFFNN